MKTSLLKWLSHLYKGTTYGYATGKDCLVVFGFLLSIFALTFLLNSIGIGGSIFIIFIVPFILTIIATYSLICMRINDICGKWVFKTKGDIFHFWIIYILIGALIGVFGRFGLGSDILKSIFDILCLLILCIYPSSKEREEMSIVEYKLPKKAITVLIAITAIIYGLFLYKTINDSKDIDSLLVKTANEVNKSLPIMIDSETRLDATMAANKTYYAYYTLVNFSKDEIDTNEIKNYVYHQGLNFIRTASSLKIFRDNKVTMRYLYRDKEGKEIIKFSFSYEDYREDKPILDTMELWDNEKIDPIVEYTETLRIKPDDYETLNLRGVKYFLKGDYDQAIEDFNASLKIKPDDQDVLYNRGGTYYRKGNYDLAIEDLNAALKIEPDFHAALYYRGMAYYEKGNYGKATKDLETVLKIDPNNVEAREGLEEIRQIKKERKKNGK